MVTLPATNMLCCVSCQSGLGVICYTIRNPPFPIVCKWCGCVGVQTWNCLGFLLSPSHTGYNYGYYSPPTTCIDSPLTYSMHPMRGYIVVLYSVNLDMVIYLLWVFWCMYINIVQTLENYGDKSLQLYMCSIYTMLQHAYIQHSVPCFAVNIKATLGTCIYYMHTTFKNSHLHRQPYNAESVLCNGAGAHL